MGMETATSQGRDGHEVSRCLGGLFLIFFFIPWVFYLFFPHYFLVTSQDATTVLKNNKVYRRGEKFSKVSRGCRNSARRSGCFDKAVENNQSFRQAPGSAKPCSEQSLYIGSSRGLALYWVQSRIQEATCIGFFSM